MSVLVINPNATQDEINKKLVQNIEGACNADGSWKKGWEPTVQSYVRKEGEGSYVVVHNLNKINYSLNISLVRQTIGTIEISEQTDVSFRVKVTKNKRPMDSEFRFSICLVGDK